MKLVQARVPDAYYDLLRKAARKKRKPMQEIVREALRAHLLPDGIDTDDPLLTAFPLFRSKGRGKEAIARRHDEFLYGWSH